MRLELSKTLKGIAIGIPILLCLVVFMQNRSLFLDSLNLARNIGERSYVGFLSPLSYEQSAPVLFLWLSKLLSSLLGVCQYCLRLLPLSAALGSLFFVRNVSKIFMRPLLGTIFIFWLGTHELFIRYATEYKQYMVDMFVTLLLIHLALRFRTYTKKNFLIVSGIGALAIWLSMPSIFVLAGIVIFIFLENRTQRASLLPIVGMALLFALSFAIQYYYILVPAIESTHMQNFHHSFFLDGRFWNMDALAHDFGLVESMIRMIVGKSAVAIGGMILLLLLGVYTALKQKKKEMILIVFPIVAAFGASYLSKYSILQRLMLFAMPLYMLWALVGLEWVIDRALQPKMYITKMVAFICSLALIVGFAQKQGIRYFFDPLEIEENRKPIEYMASEYKKGDKYDIICTPLAYPAYDYYLNKEASVDRQKIGKGFQTTYKTKIALLAKKILYEDGGVWIFAAHMSEDEIDRLIYEFEPEGIIKKSRRWNKSAAIFLSK